MKRTCSFALALVLAVSFAACGGAPVSGISSASSSAPLPQSSSSAVSASLPQSSSSVPPLLNKVPAPPLAPEDVIPWVYAISLDDDLDDYPVGEVAFVNQDGVEVLRGYNIDILYDILTGEPRALAQWRMRATPGEPTPDDDRYGDCESALYSLSGQILQDWAPGVFRGAFGAYVVRASRHCLYMEYSPKEMPGDGFETALVQINTGEVVLEGAYDLTAFSNGTIAVYDAATIVMGVIDASLNRVAGFPMRRDYYAIFEWEGTGRYLADEAQMNENNGYTTTGHVLNADFSEQTAFPDWYLVNEGLGGGCLIRYSSWELMDADTGEAVLDLADTGFPYVDYFDGEVMVGSSKLVGADNDYTLATADGAVIAGGFSELHSLLDPSIAKADMFAGIRGGALVLVNRAGDVLKRWAPGAYSDISYYGPDHPLDDFALTEPRYIMSGNAGPSRVLYDMDFNELIPPGIYRRLSPLGKFQRWSGPVLNEPVWHNLSRFLAGRRPEGTVDILDLDGNLLLEGLDEISDYSTDQRLVAEADGFIGLMDLSGNWLWTFPATSRGKRVSVK